MPSWLVGQASHRAQTLVSDALSREGMRRQHFTVLTSLSEQGEASQAALGRRLWIDRSDLHAIVGELEGEGLRPQAQVTKPIALPVPASER